MGVEIWKVVRSEEEREAGVFNLHCVAAVARTLVFECVKFIERIEAVANRNFLFNFMPNNP